MLKARQFTAHAPSHVTHRHGSVTTTIFGIPDPYLRCHCTTFMGLRWKTKQWLLVTSLMLKVQSSKDINL